MHAPSTTSDPTACSHPYAGARSCAHSDHIAPAPIDAPAHRCPAAQHEILLAPSRSAPRRAAPRPPARPPRRKRARADARSGRMRGRVSADVRGGDACAQGWRGVGGRVERQTPPRREATGCGHRTSLRRRPNLPPRMPRHAGSSVEKGRPPPRAHASRRHAHVFVIGVHARRTPSPPAHPQP